MLGLTFIVTAQGFKYNVTWPYCRDWNVSVKNFALFVILTGNFVWTQTLYELAENNWVDYNAWLADQEENY